MNHSLAAAPRGSETERSRRFIEKLLEGQRKIFGAGGTSSRSVMLSVPHIFRWWLPLVAAVQLEKCGGTLDARTKEIAILTTSITNECTYCISHNKTLGSATGVDETIVNAIRNPTLHASLSPRDAAIIEWSQLVTLNQAKYKPAVRERLKEFFTEGQIVELTLASAMFCMINRLHDAMAIELEAPEVVALLVDAAETTTEQTLIDYMRSTLDLPRT